MSIFTRIFQREDGASSSVDSGIAASEAAGVSESTMETIPTGAASDDVATLTDAGATPEEAVSADNTTPNQVEIPAKRSRKSMPPPLPPGAEAALDAAHHLAVDKAFERILTPTTLPLVDSRVAVPAEGHSTAADRAALRATFEDV